MNVIEIFAKFVVDTKALDTAQKSVSALGSAASGIGRLGASAFGALAKGVGVATGAIGAFAAGAVKTGQEFDVAMSQVAATLGTTTDDIQDLRDFARDMGRETKFTATEAAEALNYMALAGYDAEKSMEMLPTVLNLASAGAMDLGYASDMVTDVSSALGLSTRDTAAMVDQMALASSKANYSVSQLGEAMLQIGATAADMKGGSAEIATILGVFADNGIKGAEGGTHLRNILLSLQKPTDTAAALMKQYGITVYDQFGNMRSMVDVIHDMQDAFEGMSTEEVNDIVTRMFNKTDLAAVNALLKTDADRFDELQEAIEGAWFTTDGLNDALYDVGMGSLQTIKSKAFDELGIDAETFDEILRQSNGDAEAFFDRLSEAAETTDAWDVFVDEIGGGAASLQKAFDNVAGASDAMASTQINNLSGALTILGSAFSDLQIAVSDELSPTLTEFVEEATFGLQRVVAAFNANGIQGAVDVFGDVLANMLSLVVEKLPMFIEAGTTLLGALLDGLIGNSDIILGAISQVVTQLLDSLTEALNSDGGDRILAFIFGLIQIFNDNIDTILQIGFTILEGIIRGIVESIPVIIDSVVILLEALIQAITDNFEIIVEGALQIILALAQGLATHLPTLIPQIVNMIIYIAEVLTQPDNLLLIIQAAVQIIGAVITGIVKAIPNLVRAIPQVIVNLVQALMLAIPEVLKVGGLLIEGLIEGIFGALAGLVVGIVDVCKSIVDSFKEFFGIHSPSTVFSDLGGNLMQGLLDGISGMAGALWDKVTEIAGGIGDAIGGVVDAAKSWGSDMMDNLSSGISSAYNTVSGAVSGAASKVKGFLHFSEPDEGPLSDFHTYAPDMMALFAKGVTDNEDLVTDAVNSAFDFGNMTVAPTMGAEALGGFNGRLETLQPTATNPVTVVLQVDKTQLGKVVFNLNKNEVQRMGVSLAEGY